MAPKCVGAAVVAVVAGAFPGPIGAQSARFTYGASLDGAATHDDNIYFERDERVDGVAMRFRPGLDLGYRASRDVSFDGAYSFDADVYPSQSELNDLFASQVASLGARVALNPRLSAHLAGSWSRSNTSSDLIGGSGLELGRLRGTSWGGQLGLSRRMSAHGSLALDYSYQVVSFEDDPSTRAQSVTLGWTQEITARTGVALSAGPRFVDGGTSTEVSASIRHQLEHGSLSLAYGRSRYPAPGQEVDTESVAATAQIPLSKTVTLSASPGVYRNRFGDDEKSRALRMLLVTSWQLRPSLTLRATYQHVRQDARPELGLAFRQGPWIARNVFAVSFSAGVGRPRGTSASPGIGPTAQGPTP